MYYIDVSKCGLEKRFSDIKEAPTLLLSCIEAFQCLFYLKEELGTTATIKKRNSARSISHCIEFNKKLISVSNIEFK